MWWIQWLYKLLWKRTQLHSLWHKRMALLVTTWFQYFHTSIVQEKYSHENKQTKQKDCDSINCGCEEWTFLWDISKRMAPDSWNLNELKNSKKTPKKSIARHFLDVCLSLSYILYIISTTSQRHSQDTTVDTNQTWTRGNSLNYQKTF